MGRSAAASSVTAMTRDFRKTKTATCGRSSIVASVQRMLCTSVCARVHAFLVGSPGCQATGLTRPLAGAHAHPTRTLRLLLSSNRTCQLAPSTRVHMYRSSYSPAFVCCRVAKVSSRGRKWSTRPRKRKRKRPKGARPRSWWTRSERASRRTNASRFSSSLIFTSLNSTYASLTHPFFLWFVVAHFGNRHHAAWGSVPLHTCQAFASDEGASVRITLAGSCHIQYMP